MTDNPFGASSGGGWISWKSDSKIFNVDGEAVELKKIAADPRSMKVGVGKIAPGVPPHFIWPEVPGGRRDSPEKEYKKAFALDCHVAQKDGAPSDGARLWRSNGWANFAALEKVWGDVHAQAKANDGKWVVLKMTGIESVKTKNGKTVNIPQLAIDGWVDAPEGASAGADLF